MNGGHRHVWGYSYKIFSICGYPFYRLKRHKLKIVSDPPVPHYSLIGTEYLSSTIIVSTNSPKISMIAKRDIYQLNVTHSN